MANEYGTVEELKTWVGIDLDDTRDDDNLAIALAAASREVDRFCNRRFYADGSASARTYKAAADCTHVFTDDFYSTDELAVATGTGFTTSYDSDDYELLGGSEGRPYTGLVMAAPLTSDPYRKTVQVTAHWGWEAVPVEVRQATLISAARLYKRKDAITGVLGFASADLGGMRLGTSDPDVVALLSPYRKVGWA